MTTHYRQEQEYWNGKGKQPYSVLSPADQLRLRSWIGEPSDGAVLDLGGGSGAAGHLIGDREGVWSVCLDISFEMVRHATALPVQGDALRLPFADGSFALIIVAAFLHHVPGMESTVLQEGLRVLAPGGRIVGYDPSALCLQNRLFMQSGPLRSRRFSPDERPIDPRALAAIAARVGLADFRYRTFSFRYAELTVPEVIQRYLLTPLARGPLRAWLDRWFFWEATREPPRGGAC